MPRDLPPGIRRLPTSYQAYFEHRGRVYSKTFPLTTALGVLKDWRERTRAAVKFGTPTAPTRTFAEDASDYLALASAMPSFATRQYQIARWVDAFGARDRQTLTAAEIRGQLERWRVSGHVDGTALTNGSLNRRRTALMALFTMLDGRSRPNIVKDVPAYDERPRYLRRAYPLATLARIVWRVDPQSHSRARLRVMLATGWPHALIKSIRPVDVDWTSGRVRLAARRKGQGMASEWVPVLPSGLRALRRLFHLKAQGPFSNSSLHSTFARAQATENAARAARECPPLPPLRVYDIRHAFGTWAAGFIRDNRALSELLRTNAIEVYTASAVTARLDQALQDLQDRRRFRGDSGGLRRSEPKAKAAKTLRKRRK
jgi:integrase